MREIDDKLNEIIDSKSIHGVIVCTIKNDKIETYSKGTTNGQNLVSLDTRYDLASLTKIFVTTRIFQLIDNNQLRLDTVVKDIISDFNHDSMTISELLLHTSGMLPSARPRYELSGKALLDYIFSMNDYVDEQRGQTVYSCINYIILGEIINHIDKPLDRSINDNILSPLNMTDTSFNGYNAAPTQVLEDGSLIQERVHDQTAFALGGTAGNAGLFSSMRDLVRFVDGLLNNDSILSPQSRQLILKTNIGNRSYGWNRLDNNVLFHTGSTGPLLHIDFEKKEALILLTNRTYPNRDNQTFIDQRDQLFNLYLKTK